MTRQKLLQVAVLLSYDHPLAYRNVSEGLEQAMGELSQVNAVIFEGPPEVELNRRERRWARQQQRRDARRVAQVKPNLKSNYLAHVAWKKEQIQQIIDLDYNVLVLFGDELIDLDESLLAAQQAGLLIVYCGFAGKAPVSGDPLSSLSIPGIPVVTADGRDGSPQRYILNESADRSRFLDEDSEDLPMDSRGVPLSYLVEEGLGEEAPLPPAIGVGPETQREAEGRSAVSPRPPVGLVHINIRPVGVDALSAGFTKFLLDTDRPEATPRGLPGKASVLLLFGPAELPFTRKLYRQMRQSIKTHRDVIKAVRFLDPLNIDSQDQVRRLVLDLPPDGRIVAMEPLLFYSSAQILRRYSLGTKIAGLGWQDAGNALPAGGNVQLLVPLQYEALAYASLYAAFALYSGRKEGKSGEYFLLGDYGLRQVGPEGSLVVDSFDPSAGAVGKGDYRVW
ncbi:hypothetical protein P0082_09095 [Candidatus Haliotispira prima]|uniref:ABC-type uncharacterized transport system domain-containing protein n=1 Tax=Candidatus Haliotispira prima TaxID=3034016 RepID=A0ABY8MF69_9SPIO|nr:hypothetical protein P0082_09095 [Candidatus Haliotispira prima]